MVEEATEEEGGEVGGDGMLEGGGGVVPIPPDLGPEKGDHFVDHGFGSIVEDPWEGGRRRVGGRRREGGGRRREEAHLHCFPVLHGSREAICTTTTTL